MPLNGNPAGEQHNPSPPGLNLNDAAQGLNHAGLCVSSRYSFINSLSYNSSSFSTMGPAPIEP